MATNPRRPRTSAASGPGFDPPPEMGPVDASSSPEPRDEFEAPPGEAPGEDTMHPGIRPLRLRRPETPSFSR